MSMIWTEEQKQVIDLRNRNILVSAAAGSGKTAVLVERIKERILDKAQPVDIDKMLVVTFTNAAAAQMKERVAKVLEQEMLLHPADIRLQQQSALVQNAQITTIDSFCLYIIRNHFHEIDLEPDFRIADEGELKLLCEDIADKIMEECYERQEEGYLRLIDCFGTARGDEPVRAMILQLYNYAQSYPWPMQWLNEVLAPYHMENIEELKQSECMKNAYFYVKKILVELLDKAEQYVSVCQESDGPFMYEAACEQDVELLTNLAECDSYEACAEAAAGIAFATLGRTKSYNGSVEKQEYVKTARKQVKDTLVKLKDTYFTKSGEEVLAQMERIRPLAEALVDVTKLFADGFAKRKREKNIVDFGDLEHFALKILVDEETKQPTAAALELRRNFEEIMIDEYQDSNYVQEQILKMISREEEGAPNIFMVGDVKQSIYRFRLARPELFMEKYDTYSAKDSDRQKIDLHKNFRSRAEVLDFTNDIFSQIMKRDLGGVDYNDEAALYYGASFAYGKPGQSGMSEHDFTSELLIADEDRSLMEESGLSRQELEAKLVAGRIRELMEHGRVIDEDTKELRRVRYSDIVILLRSLGGWADTFANILNANGIPAHTISKTGYFSTIEIQTVLHYLRILDNPKQDIPLAAVLKSPIVGMSDTELAKLRMTEEDIPFHACVKQAIENMTEDPAAALTEPGTDCEWKKAKEHLWNFAVTYQKLRGQVSELPIHELLMMILEETGYGGYAASMPAGRQRMANLNMLIEKAIDYERTSYRGLFHFIRYIDELQKYDVDFGEADMVGENDDAVNIMSIHKSKGLEFPICFVSGMGKAFNKQDVKSRMILHPSLGIGLDEMDEKRRLKIPSFYKKLIVQQTELENLGEELRVLYVAFTRAKEKLIVTGTRMHAAEDLEQMAWEYHDKKPLSFLVRSAAKTYLDLILPAVISDTHKYRVQVVTVDSLAGKETERQIEESLSLYERVQDAERVKEEAYRSLDEKLSYVYPYQNAVDLLTKYSVSELKHRAMRRKAAEEELDTTPVFMQEVITPYVPVFMAGKAEENRGALRGTAVHRLLECYDFTELPENPKDLPQNIEKQLTGLIRAGKVTESMRELIPISSIVEFLDSDLAKRMKQAAMNHNLFREKPFVMGRKEEEMILIQGIMDVFWVEEDGIVLLDYKTDRIDREQQLRNMYTEQLELYADALHRIFKLPVRERYLYSFRLHKAVQV